MQQFANPFRWFLAGYLVLLLNVGPSLHRSHVLDYHDDTCCVVPQVEDDCCGCQSHFDESNELLAESSVEKTCDCPFCKFFDQFHVVPALPPEEIFVRANRMEVFVGSTATSLLFVQPHARGPPSC